MKIEQVTKRKSKGLAETYAPAIRSINALGLQVTLELAGADCHYWVTMTRTEVEGLLAELKATEKKTREHYKLNDAQNCEQGETK